MISGVLSLLLLILASCQSEDIPVPEPSAENPLTVTISLTVPVMHSMETRGDFANSPGEDLKLTVMEFYAADKEAPASQWWLKNVYKAQTLSNTDVANGGTVKFDVTFNSTDAPTHLHLMVADDYITNVDFGSEATVLPFVTVSGNQEAYWGMVNFEDGLTETIVSEGENHEIITETKLRDEVRGMLQNVPVIRNFACIKVTDAETTDNFELMGFGVVHIPEEGTVAPINPDIENPDIPVLIDGGTMKSYSQISEVYSGFTPTTATFENKETEIRNWNFNTPGQTDITLEPKYIYEHPYESTRRTYLLVYGLYKPTGAYGYYKVDIGIHNTETGMFDYYNIIRNIQYDVRITAVRAPGSASVAEAITRAPFNNVSASVETSNMLNASNGTNMLAVNATSHIIVTEDQKIDILYRYIQDVTGSKTVANEIPTFICQAPGPVVKSYQQIADSVDKNNVRWRRYVITPQPPTDEVKTQNITIVDPDGLGRTIKLTLRKPWNYAPLYAGTTSCITVHRGAQNIYTFNADNAAPQDISNEADQNLTVYFNLPNGLPESMFPLQFILEAQKQGIENNKVGNLMVHTGPSLFNPDITSISYIKTVTYAEYLYQYENDISNDVDVDKPNTNHTVRCRFTTISNVIAGSDGTIRVHNDYFTPDVDVTFVRTNVP